MKYIDKELPKINRKMLPELAVNHLHLDSYRFINKFDLKTRFANFLWVIKFFK